MRKRTSSTKRYREQARQRRQEDKDRRRAERKAAKDSGVAPGEPTAETAGMEDEYREEGAELEESAEVSSEEGGEATGDAQPSKDQPASKDG